MSDVIKAAILTAILTAFYFVVDRWLQFRAARNQERVITDDDPRNDHVYDDLAEDLANDTKPKGD